MTLRTQLTTYILYAIMSLLAAVMVKHNIIAERMLGQNTAAFIPMLNGTMEKPYVYRTLLPSLARVITTITPLAIQDGFNILFAQSRIFPFLSKYYAIAANQREYLFPVTLIVIMMWIAAVTYGLTLSKLYCYLFPNNKAMAPVISVFGLFVLVPFDSYAKLYDFPTLALTTLCLLYLYEQKWKYYLFFFALACINKETAFMLLGLFALIHCANRHDRIYRNMLLLQILIYTIIICVIHYDFSSNPGRDFYPHIQWISPMFFQDFQNPVHMIVIIMLCGLIISRWHEIPVILRLSLWLVPVNALLYYFCCLQGEYRDFFEVFPYLTLMAGHGIFSPQQKNVRL